MVLCFKVFFGGSQLEIHGVGVSTEDANQKFLRSLPSSWSQVSLVMRTKPGVDSLSIDDLYNNLRVFESDIKGSTGSSSSTQNAAFVSSESTNNTNDVSTAYGVSTSSGYNLQRENSSSYTEELISSTRRQRESCILMPRNQLDLTRPKSNATIVTRQGILLESADQKGIIDINQKTMEGDLENRRNLKLCQMSARDKAGIGYGDQMNKDVISPPPITRIYIPSGPDKEIDDSQFTYGPKQPKPSESDARSSDFNSCKSNSSEETLESMLEPVVNEPKVVSQPKVWSDAPIIEEYKSNSDDEHVSLPIKEQETPSFAFINTIKHVKTLRQTIKEQNTYSKSPKPVKKDCSGLMSKKLGLGYGFTKKACFVCGSFSHLIRDCDFHEKRMAKQAELNKRMCKGTGQREKRPVWNNVQRVNHQNQFVPTAVLTRTGRIQVNTARTSGINNVNTVRHNFNSQAVPTNATRKVHTVKPIVNNDYPQRALENKGIVDSGCSRHMTRNKAYLTEYQDYNGGPVAFGGSKGYITGKGKIKTGRLDFEDVCFVKDLQHFNLFSVSQMCDKKNKVLFTDTECLVLSPEFKLPDENQVLLRVPRQNNMYSFNLENIVPSGGLACLITKATVDESNKWHRRFSWVFFLRTKDETSGILKDFIRQIENQLNQKVKTIRCDNGTEFKNRDFIEFCGSKGIKREYSNVRTLQQNGVLKERTAVSTACYVLNRVLVTKLIFDGMMRHLDATKKFVMYPRFLQIFLRNQLKDVTVPMDQFPVLTLIKKRMRVKFQKDHLNPNQYPLLLTQVKTNLSHSLTHLPDLLLLSLFVIPIHRILVGIMEVTAQAAEIKNLKSQIKQLKKKAKPVINHHKAWFRAARLKKQQKKKDMENSKKRRSVSKQGRKAVKYSKGAPSVHTHTDWDAMDTDLEATLNDAMDYTLTQDEGKTKQQSTVKPDEGTDKQNEGTDRTKISTDSFVEGTAEIKDQVSGESDTPTAPTTTSTPTPTVFGDDETIAQVLVTMSQNKLKQKEKGVELKNVEDIERPRPTLTRSLLTLKPLPKIDPKAKGKGMIEEEDESDTESEDINEAEKKFKMLANDEEMARKVQEEWEAEEEKKRLAEEEATKAAFTNEYDFIQARLNADKILAEKLQEEEREKFTIEERAKLLHDTIAAQRRFLAQQRSEVIRNKLPSRTQLRNQMMTYLKHVGGKKHSDLKTKIFEEIQVLYEKVKRSDENFIAIGSVKDERLMQDLNKKATGIKKDDSIKEESKEEEGTKKRKLGTRKKMKSRKRRFRQNTSEDDESNSEKENDELRLCLTIAPDEDKEVDYEILNKKYPIIEWKSEYLGIKPQSDETKDLEEINLNVVIRSNGQRRYIPEGFNRVLWGDLMIMFNPSDEDEFWNSQQDWNVVSWKLYGSSGVHTLMTEAGLVIHMLVEKKYPLRKKVLLQMLKLKLESENTVPMAMGVD
ncbi:ribonuclease H-like domain-containing protein [Tanacetum coccineum]